MAFKPLDKAFGWLALAGGLSTALGIAIHAFQTSWQARDYVGAIAGALAALGSISHSITGTNGQPPAPVTK